MRSAGSSKRTSDGVLHDGFRQSEVGLSTCLIIWQTEKLLEELSTCTPARVFPSVEKASEGAVQSIVKLPQ